MHAGGRSRAVFTHFRHDRIGDHTAIDTEQDREDENGENEIGNRSGGNRRRPFHSLAPESVCALSSSDMCDRPELSGLLDASSSPKNFT